MAEGERDTFDGERASVLVKELRQCFNTGKTKNYEWRVSQLENILKMVEQREEDILSALHNDLSKPQQEAFVSEVSL